MRLQPQIEAKDRSDSADKPDRDPAPLPVWRNTRPRGNPEPNLQDLGRSRDRLEAVLGR